MENKCLRYFGNLFANLSRVVMRLCKRQERQDEGSWTDLKNL